MQPYQTAAEHWADEMRLLDRKIEFKLRCRMELEDDNPLDPMRGLLITDEEVRRLLEAESGPSQSLPPAIAAMEREIGELELLIGKRLERSAEAGHPPPLVRLAQRLMLSPFERRCVVLALAPELDRKYEKLFGFMQDDVTCKQPTVDLALRLLCAGGEERLAARAAFRADRPLVRWLLEPQENEPAFSTISRLLKLDARTVSFLLETEPFDGRLSGLAERFDPADPNADGELPPLLVGEPLQREMRRFAELHCRSRRSDGADTEGDCPIIHLWGPEGSGKRLHAKHLARHLGMPLLLLRLPALEGDGRRLELHVRRLLREARLTGAIVAFAGGERLTQTESDLAPHRNRLREWLHGWSEPIVWLSEERCHYSELPFPEEAVFMQAEIPLPSAEEQRLFWQARGGGKSAEIGGLPDKFRLTPGQIERAAQHARLHARREDAEVPTARHFEAGALAQIRHDLEKKARKLKPRYTWDDLVLPPEPLGLLRQACDMMRFRRRVYGDWGFDRKLSYGKGLSMLFAGPPGTGKTMAAEVAANVLQLEAYKIDLSQVISKYIGETEKNLHDIFQEAQRTNAILFFDESDALFGKRSEVKDAHDKYANVETAYLLQKMEEYEGVSILATNFQQNIDDAFLRRINIVVKFPFPDAEHREKLWRSMIPSATPLSDDVDFAALASKIEVAGGNIKNIVLTAAFMAASAGTRVGMRELVAAARQELRKSGKILVGGEWDGFF
ncbi:ATP-binding protein [Paenibacillus humicola]|uniref:ATP-binding protein n=1 Tax=Paenibacillus humicola TaxID=3110540 RepID=UPI00237BDF40|nr:ATP-binding protein [Paenibacillus humicola]